MLKLGNAVIIVLCKKVNVDFIGLGEISMDFLKKAPIKAQLVGLAISTIAVVLLVLFVSYFRIVNIITKNNNEYMSGIMDQIKNNISSNCKIYSRILINIAYNAVIQDYIVEPDMGKRFETVGNVSNIVSNIQEMHEGIIDIAIISDIGSSYFLRGQTVEEIKQVISEAPKNLPNYYTGEKHIEYDLEKKSCFFIISNIYSIKQNRPTGEKIGTAAIVFNMKPLGAESGLLSPGSPIKFYLLDRENTVYSSNDPLISAGEPDVLKAYKNFGSGNYNAKIDNKSFIINIEYTPEINGKIISVVPEKALLSDVFKTGKMILDIFILAMIILSIPFLFVINNILNPLNKFREFVVSIKSGNLKGLQKRIQLGGYAEMGVMGNEFNGMLDEIDSLTHRLLMTNTKLYELELEKKQSELAFLQSQMNPHFLYNTLESIKGIAIMRGVNEISEMTAAFGNIVRYSVKGVDMVTISEELNIVKSYIKIQQIRFEDRIDVFYDFTEEVLQCKILKMILQPIVENAIYHGLEPKIDKGCLWISSNINEDGDIIIKVKDDGIGIDHESLISLKELLLMEKDPGTYDGTRIGIFNVNNRIRLFYGSQYGLAINSTYGQGTEVVLRYPLRRY